MVTKICKTGSNSASSADRKSRSKQNSQTDPQCGKFQEEETQINPESGSKSQQHQIPLNLEAKNKHRNTQCWAKIRRKCHLKRHEYIYLYIILSQHGCVFLCFSNFIEFTQKITTYQKQTCQRPLCNDVVECQNAIFFKRQNFQKASLRPLLNLNYFGKIHFFFSICVN